MLKSLELAISRFESGDITGIVVSTLYIEPDRKGGGSMLRPEKIDRLWVD
jgi:hypothetical protein